VDNWPHYLKEIFRILIPGSGWAQLFEFGFPFACSNNGTLPDDAALNKVPNLYDWPLTGSCLVICKRT